VSNRAPDVDSSSRENPQKTSKIGLTYIGPLQDAKAALNRGFGTRLFARPVRSLDLHSVLRSAHSVGVFSPILSIGDLDHAARLVRLYEVDALFPAADDPQLRTFADRFSHLR
jgi:hypothetical protein